jgi:thiol:disulfide interchange protein DsbD
MRPLSLHSVKGVVLLVCLFFFADVRARSMQDTISSADVEFAESAPVEDTGVPPAAADSGSLRSATGTANAVVAIPAPPDEAGQSLWAVFLAGAVGGFLAFLMPCIYPMVPLTVSFFTKRAESKGKGVQGAVLYGLSIVLIYVGFGLLLTLLFGSAALNELSTDGWFNLFIFVVLLLFGISFLGAFEINLPASLASKLDTKSDSKGLTGIFFMAATLAVVSFSCTGPIIGGVLSAVSKSGEVLRPMICMFGFSGMLAVIFTLFAIFPGLLGSLPKSGGWLNAVKVVLGFLELGLALKFLSGADLAFNWKFFDREVFLSLWIVLSAFTGLYLLGKLRLPHDSELSSISVPRVILALVVLSFTVYLIPGLWGAPLKAISGLAPPMGTQDFVLGAERSSLTASPAITGSSKKYSALFHRFTPHGIDAFYDYDEGLAYAKSVGKPLFLDFTGIQCVNCRKMEENVWSDPRVLRMLKNDFVVVSLFTDSKEPLPSNEVFHSDVLKTEVNSIGKKFKHFEAKNYETISQPYYVLTDLEGKSLTAPQGADFNVENYLRFLQEGLDVFRKEQ